MNNVIIILLVGQWRGLHFTGVVAGGAGVVNGVVVTVDVSGACVSLVPQIKCLLAKMGAG